MGFVYSEPCCWREIASTKAHRIGQRRDTGELCLARTGRIPGCGPSPRFSESLPPAVPRARAWKSRVKIGRRFPQCCSVRPRRSATPLLHRSWSAIVAHKVSTSSITVIAPQGRSSSRSPFVVSNDPRIPDEVSYKAGYVNPAPRPATFGSARLWGIAIADTRVPGHESAQVEVAWSPSPRAALPLGKLEGCTVRNRVRIPAGALLQVGMEDWRSPTIPYREQSRSRRQRLVFPFPAVAGGIVHRYRRPAMLGTL